MKKMIFPTILCLLFLAHQGLAETINGAGATFPYPLYGAWAFQYHRYSGIKVNYQSIGSGGGIRQIRERTVDFGASDAPLPPDELRKARLLQFPTVIGGVVLAVNLPQEIRLDPSTLVRIYLGEITKWNDQTIKKLNPQIDLPEREIAVIYRADGSGTTAIFTHYLAQISPSWKAKVGEGTAVKFPVGLGAKGNEGVANYIKRTPYAIGYVEFAYAKQNKLNTPFLKNRDGAFVFPSFESLASAALGADFSAKNHYYRFITDASGKESWPITGATFILLAEEKKEINKKVVLFFDWAFKNGDGKAKELTYVPLPEELKQDIRNYWKINGLW